MQPSTRETHTVLCDWGTSRLRAYLQVGSSIVARCEGPGIGGLKVPADQALIEVLRPWRDGLRFHRVVACGMVGSRNGIIEVPYVQAPADSATWASQAVTQEFQDFQVVIAAGICGVNAAGLADVMRGEETQIFGALAESTLLSRGRHTLVLPGTHSKWVQIVDGRIVSVQTFITGELFALLQSHSSLLRAGDAEEGDTDGFAEGVLQSRQSGLASSLFQTRAAQLTRAKSRSWAVEFLSGLLIGDEMAIAMRSQPVDSITIIGEIDLIKHYEQAFGLYGVETNRLDGEVCSISGLRLLAARHASVPQ